MNPLHKLQQRRRLPGQMSQRQKPRPPGAGHLRIDGAKARAAAGAIADLRAGIAIPEQSDADEAAIIVSVDHDVRVRGARLADVLASDTGLQDEAQVTATQAQQRSEQLEGACSYSAKAQGYAADVDDSRAVLHKGMRELRPPLDEAAATLQRAGKLSAERVQRLRELLDDIATEKAWQQQVKNDLRSETRRDQKAAAQRSEEAEQRDQTLRDILAIKGGAELPADRVAAAYEMFTEERALTPTPACSLPPSR